MIDAAVYQIYGSRVYKYFTSSFTDDIDAKLSNSKSAATWLHCLATLVERLQMMQQLIAFVSSPNPINLPSQIMFITFDFQTTRSQTFRLLNF